MGWLAAAVERAMKRQEVILRALSGALTWLQAADILGIHPRSLRRWRARYATDQMVGLYDRRPLPSPRTAPVGEVPRILRRYQDRMPDYNATFTRAPTDSASAFMPLGDVDLQQILCAEAPRVVGPDNVVSFDGVSLQLATQPGRATCAGLRVLVRRHLDGHYTVWRGPQCLGRYSATAELIAPRVERAPTGRFRLAGAPCAGGPTPPGARRHASSPRPPAARRPRTLTRTDHVSKPRGHFTCQQHTGPGWPPPSTG